MIRSTLTTYVPFFFCLKKFNNSHANSGVAVLMDEGFQFDDSFNVIEETEFESLDELFSYEEQA